MGNSHLTFEEILTLFAQVEAIFINLPLCPLSTSPDNFLFLFPEHFSIGRPLHALLVRAPVNEKEPQLRRHARLATLPAEVSKEDILSCKYARNGRQTIQD